MPRNNEPARWTTKAAVAAPSRKDDAGFYRNLPPFDFDFNAAAKAIALSFPDFRHGICGFEVFVEFQPLFPPGSGNVPRPHARRNRALPDPNGRAAIDARLRHARLTRRAVLHHRAAHAACFARYIVHGLRNRRIYRQSAQAEDEKTFLRKDMEVFRKLQKRGSAWYKKHPEQKSATALQGCR
jgi:hypothetical protein